MWIKICGMTDARAVEAALEAGADAIGFVFAPSVRRLEPVHAARLAAPARGRIACVAVTRHPETALIQSILADFRPDVLQSDVEDLDTLDLPRELARLPVIRSDAAHPVHVVHSIKLPARFIFEGPASGTGRTSDWDQARALARGAELVLAGGLSAANVADAVEHVRPFGVDVSSGVEEAPGVKSAEKIRQFVAAARAASRETRR